MTPEQFCYWLQGRAELQPDVPLSDAEWKSVREHLATVFKKITPPIDKNSPTVSDPNGAMVDALRRMVESDRSTSKPSPAWPGGIMPVVKC